MRKRDYELVKEGKYNMRAIMQRAWAYKNNPFCTQYRNNFKGALKAAWTDARVKMNDYYAEIRFNENGFPKKNISLRDIAEGFLPYWKIDCVTK